MSGAGDLISTTTDASTASTPCGTPLGWRQTSPGPRIYSSLPTVNLTREIDATDCCTASLSSITKVAAMQRLWLYDINVQPGICAPSIAKLPSIMINLAGHTPRSGNFAEVGGALLESVATSMFSNAIGRIHFSDGGGHLITMHRLAERFKNFADV